MRPAPHEAKTTATTATQIIKVNFVFIVICFVVCDLFNAVHVIKLQFFEKTRVISVKVSFFSPVKAILFSLYFLIFLPISIFGQKRIVFYTTEASGFPKPVSKILQEQTSNNVSKSIQLAQNKCLEAGFYLNDFSITSSSSRWDSVRVHLGQQFAGINLEMEGLTSSQLAFISPSYRALQSETHKMSPNQYVAFMQRILAYFVDHGYPFCRVYLSQIDFDSTILRAKLCIEKGPHFAWKEIHMKNDFSISMNVIQNLIGIHVDDVYKESDFVAIEERIVQTGIFTVKKKSEVLFTENGAELFLYLERLKASSVQGIVGFQPNPTTNQVTFTGDVQMRLINAVKQNETFQFAWKSIQPGTQSMQSSLSIPFLFKSPFGIFGEFQLFKRDSSYLDVKSTLGVQYQFQNGWQLRANYHFLNSSILSGLNVNPMFSKLESIRMNNYGIMLSKRKLDYIPNPSKGFSLLVEGQLGERKVQGQTESVWKTHFVLDHYYPLAPRFTLFSQWQFDSYHASNIYENELFRFGGSNTLRGFDEESIFATTKALLTLECRFLLDRNSAVFAFFNQAYYENTALTYQKDHPYGFGFGISTGTNLGIFRLAYALGTQQNNPIQFNAGKIHLGYISYF